MNKKEIELLQEVKKILNPNYISDLVFRTSAQELRKQADELENQDRIKSEFSKLIRKLN